MMAAKRTAATRLAVLALGVALGVGCQNRTRTDIVEVTGQVTVDDVPLTSGVVLFMSDQASPATGEIGSDGAFLMTSDGYDDGVAVGTYRVCVIAPNIATADLAASKGMDTAVESLVPQRYTSVDTSGLEFEVKLGERNVANMRLTAKPLE